MGRKYKKGCPPECCTYLRSIAAIYKRIAAIFLSTFFYLIYAQPLFLYKCSQKSLFALKRMGFFNVVFARYLTADGCRGPPFQSEFSKIFRLEKGL
jgi:hypothetical protein